MVSLKLSDFNKQDLICGFLVSLIALPLSIGISIASGAPPAAGILAAFVGGVIGALYSGSKVTINGPAAGLIVIVAAAILEMGAGNPLAGFRAMLACTLIAGVLQMIMGKLKLANLGLAFPSTVVHGMLAAIGLIIVSKQIHAAMGVSPSASSPFGLIAEIPTSMGLANPAIAAIATAALAIMFLWPFLPNKISRILPAPLVAVLAGVGLGLAFDLQHSHLVHTFLKDFNLGPKYLLDVPNNLKSAFFLPDFSLVSTLVFWKHTILITLVGSAEAVLSVCAVDKIDLKNRRSDLNKSLFGNGLANVVNGCIGGLPVITEIVRSSANVSNGAKTQWSNFSHGLILIAFLILAPNLLHEIPVAALAAVLIVVGFRLAAPKHFIDAFKHGQGIVFLTTVLAILTTDLLTGVLVGTLVEFLFVFAAGKSLRLFGLNYETSKTKEERTLSVKGPLAFTNYLHLREHLNPNGKERSLTLDLSKSPVVDHTVNEHLSQHASDFAALGKSLIIQRHDSEKRHH